MKKKNILGFIFVIIGLLSFSYGLIMLNAQKFEMALTFPGIFVPSPRFALPEGFEEINIANEEGENIYGIYGDNSSSKTIYYFHGNGGPLDFFYEDIEYLYSLGYNVMALDFPGFGKSDGLPSKDKIREFSEVFYEYMVNEKGIKKEDVIICGYSIGSALAIDFATYSDYDKLILISPFTSTRDVVASKTSISFHSILELDETYPSIESIKKLDKDLLIIHGNEDIIIPFKQGVELFDAYDGNKYFLELDSIGHYLVLIDFSLALKGFIRDFIDEGKLDIETNYYKIGEEEKKKLEFENRNDLYTDSSIQKHVSAKINFNDILYYPEDLVKISGGSIYDAKGGTQVLRQVAKDALFLLGDAFIEEFARQITVTSAFRSYENQRQIKLGGCPDNYCARAGYSEHQSGLAVDIFEVSDENSWKRNSLLNSYYNWLDNNAHLYGFHNTYKKGLVVDSYEIEPWHWRYLGVELATYLHDNDMTLAEYYETEQEK